MDGINEIRDPDELWKRMRERQSSGDNDGYFLLAKRVEELINSYVGHYGLCEELATAYGLQARDTTMIQVGREVSAIRAHHYFARAAIIAGTSAGEVRVVPPGWELSGNGCIDRQTAQLKSWREAADVLLVLDWVSEGWKWQWISESLIPIVQSVVVYDPAHTLLGQAYLYLGDFDRAEAVWRQAKELPSACADLDLCLCDLRMKRAEKAVQSEDWQRVIGLLDGQCNLTPRELVLLGDAFQHLGAMDRARGTWEAAKQGDPSLDGLDERLKGVLQ